MTKTLNICHRTERLLLIVGVVIQEFRSASSTSSTLTYIIIKVAILYRYLDHSYNRNAACLFTGRVYKCLTGGSIRAQGTYTPYLENSTPIEIELLLSIVAMDLPVF